MPATLLHATVVVRDYDEALAFFVGTLGFRLLEDTAVPAQDERWVLVAPPGGEASILLARASDPAQQARIGDQTGGRVGFFLATDDLDRDVAAWRARGVRFVRERRRTPTAASPSSPTSTATCGTCSN